MNPQPLATPVVLCVYNRPQLTLQVLQSLRAAQPLHILIVADGPKTGDAADRAKCDEVISAINAIDWPGTLDWNIAPHNLGCRKRIQTGLAWAFDRVDEAIVLEDDCVPHPSFFSFCHTLLDYYRSDRRVAVISGTEPCEAPPRGASYRVSRYPLIWGWAAWRRTWDLYDGDLDAWKELRETSWLSELLIEPLATAYWRRIFDNVRSGWDMWAFSLVFSCWRAGALSVHSTHNLVSNIGFGSDATHTRQADSPVANLPVQEMSFPLIHPERFERDIAHDERLERTLFSGTARQRLQLARDVLRGRAQVPRNIWRRG